VALGVCCWSIRKAIRRRSSRADTGRGGLLGRRGRDIEGHNAGSGINLSCQRAIDFGASLAIGLLIGLVAGAVLASGVLVEVTKALSAAAVYTIESLANNSVHLPLSEWQTIAGVFGLVGAGAEIPWSWVVIATAFSTPGLPEGISNAIAEDGAASMVLAMISLVFGVLAIHVGSPIILLFAFVLATLSLFAVAANYFHYKSELSSASFYVGLVDLGLSGCAMAGAGADLTIRVLEM
jgi:hypothetical protein